MWMEMFCFVWGLVQTVTAVYWDGVCFYIPRWKRQQAGCWERRKWNICWEHKSYCSNVSLSSIHRRFVDSTCSSNNIDCHCWGCVVDIMKFSWLQCMTCLCTRCIRPLTHSPETVTINSTPDSCTSFSCWCTTSNIVDCRWGLKAVIDVGSHASAQKNVAGIWHWI